VHVLSDPLEARPPRGEGAHEGNAGDLLSAALLLGHLPRRVVLVGIEPEEFATRIGLSESVRRALPKALDAARAELARLVAGAEAARCTS
jgi:hydrogenase maturation protease